MEMAVRGGGGTGGRAILPPGGGGSRFGPPDPAARGLVTPLFFVGMFCSKEKQSIKGGGREGNPPDSQSKHLNRTHSASQELRSRRFSPQYSI